MTVAALIVVPGLFGVAGSTVDHRTVWADVHGRPLLWHAVRGVCDAGVERVVLVVEPVDVGRTRTLFPDAVVVAAPGAVGWGSVLAGVTDAATVLVHDPHRALAPAAMIRRVLDALRTGAVAVVPVLPVVDTIRSVGVDGRASAVVDRDTLRIVQTPQGFDRAVLGRALAGAPSGSDPTALVVAAGSPLTTVAGHADAGRVLTAADLDHARRVLGSTSSAVDLRESTHG